MKNKIFLPTFVILGALFFISPIEDWFIPITECEPPLEFFEYDRQDGVETCKDDELLGNIYPLHTMANPES